MDGKALARRCVAGPLDARRRLAPQHRAGDRGEGGDAEVDGARHRVSETAVPVVPFEARPDAAGTVLSFLAHAGVMLVHRYILRFALPAV